VSGDALTQHLERFNAGVRSGDFGRMAAAFAPDARMHRVFNAYRREHYRMNRDAYIQRNSRVLLARRRKWVQRLCEYLLAHPCVDCGEADPIVLEFDHVDRATKLQTVGFLAGRGYPWTTVEVELTKCDVRCANCHRRRTAAQFDWPKLHRPHAPGMIFQGGPERARTADWRWGQRGVAL
jgi:hypothetical protein